MRKFDYVAGVGGIGKGILFKFLQDRTLSRNESRLAALSPARDYCKMHIILHYPAVFLRGRCPVYPIGSVGRDATGEELLRCMAGAGMDTRFVETADGADTLYSVCFQYPNGDGGNITADQSACGLLNEEQIDRFFAAPQSRGAGMLLAAPEVPLEMRRYFLARGRERGCYTAASFGTAEAEEFLSGGALRDVDLLALNLDEAAAAAGAAPDGPEDIPAACYRRVAALNPRIALIVTRGAEGSDLFSEGRRIRQWGWQVPVVSTAGAGDCLLGTVMAALCCQVPLLSEDGGDSPALLLGAAGAAVKVSVIDSIDFDISKAALRDMLRRQGADTERPELKGFWQ